MVFSKWPYVAIAGVVATGFWIIFNVFDQLLFFSPVLFFYLPGAHRKYECICARTIKEAEGGLEIVGELNDFVRESIKEFYHNIDENHDVRILLVNSQDRILPEVSEDLGAHWS